MRPQKTNYFTKLQQEISLTLKSHISGIEFKRMKMMRSEISSFSSACWDWQHCWCWYPSVSATLQAPTSSRHVLQTRIRNGRHSGENISFSMFQRCHCNDQTIQCVKESEEGSIIQGCIRKDHVRYCCEDDFSSPQWLYSKTPFIPEDSAGGEDMVTCIRRQELWLGGDTKVSNIGEVSCSDPTFVHCRSRWWWHVTWWFLNNILVTRSKDAISGYHQYVNICQSVMLQCNEKCFKGRN